METVKGIVKQILFQNVDSGFTVLCLEEERTDKEHTCVGVMPTVLIGQSVSLTGYWSDNKRFGLQFSVDSFSITPPTTTRGIFLLLSSGLISDIGPVRAQAIVDHFGMETLKILDSKPNLLQEVPGIGKKRLSSIINGWNKQNAIKNLALFLQEFGVTINAIQKIYAVYGDKAQSIISTNPYQLIDDIWGVGFKKADAIASHIGFDTDSYKRIKAGIIFVLKEASNEGHIYLPKEILVERAVKILSVLQERVIYSLDHCIDEKIVKMQEDRIYLPVYFNAEMGVARLLARKLSLVNSQQTTFNDSFINQWLSRYTISHDWQPDPKQIDAVKAAIQNFLLLLTGGPGTGKTTTLQVIVSFFRMHNLQISLVAPTGRAAQRMGTIAGLKAQTIHRLLEFNPQRKESPFAKNRNNKLVTDVIICDEVSMIDTILMRSLLEAVKDSTRIIFVGDSNQLPSVGPGNVLADMISSKTIPHITLTTIFRQARTSRIITASHEIINGMLPIFQNLSEDTCFFMPREEPDSCLETITDLVVKRLPNKYNIDSIRDIQVLSPMNKGKIGTHSINKSLQALLIKSREHISKGDTSYFLGDKVMQIHNNYDSGVFNGDIGYISRIIEGYGCLVDFGEKIVEYQIKDLDELVHAYCISIHKSQGCEFHTVVIPVMTQHYIMLQRNLLYTAVTRARNFCILVGSMRALALAVNNAEAFHRYTHLSQHLQKKETITQPEFTEK